MRKMLDEKGFAALPVGLKETYQQMLAQKVTAVRTLLAEGSPIGAEHLAAISVDWDLSPTWDACPTEMTVEDLCESLAYRYGLAIMALATESPVRVRGSVHDTTRRTAHR